MKIKYLGRCLCYSLALVGVGCVSSHHNDPNPITTSPSGNIGATIAPPPTTQLIEPGDLLEITFFTEVQPQTEYLLQLGDTLQIIFSYQTPEANSVIIRPDGKISLPVVGDVVAQGSTANQLAERLAKIFALQPNKVSVISLTANTQVQEFLNTLAKNENRSGTRATVRADGLLTLPLLGSLHAQDLTVEELRDKVYNAYGKLFPALNVSVEVIDSPSRRVAVLGEVEHPGVFPSNTPISHMEALALAGGLKDDAKKDQVLLFKHVTSGYEVYHINVTGQTNDPTSFRVFYLGPQDVIFVPKSGVEYVDQYWAQYVLRIIPFTASANAAYTLK